MMLQYLNYILLDAARMEIKMEIAKQLNPDHQSLYRGESEIDLAGVAPYLFTFKADNLFSAWFGEKGWGNSWGVLLKTGLPKEEVQKHFRKFLMVNTEDGEELYFRFYDPRVLRIFLPTCDREQIFEFFGRIDYFLLEDEDPEWALKMWQENGELKQSKIARADLAFLAFDQELFDSTIKVEEDNDELLMQEALAYQKKNELNESQTPVENKSDNKKEILIESQNKIQADPFIENKDRNQSSTTIDSNTISTKNKSKWNLFD